jgi:hypothetical protein
MLPCYYLKQYISVFRQYLASDRRIKADSCEEPSTMAICTVLAYFGVFMFSGNFLLVYGDIGKEK